MPSFFLRPGKLRVSKKKMTCFRRKSYYMLVLYINGNIYIQLNNLHFEKQGEWEEETKADHAQIISLILHSHRRKYIHL